MKNPTKPKQNQSGIPASTATAIARKINHAYGPRNRVQLKMPNGPSLTKQEFAEECDTTFIINQYRRTGQFTHLNQQRASYDIAPATDFREALEIVSESEQTFAELPAKLRAEFNNDPAQFLDYMDDPMSRPEIDLQGLFEIPGTNTSEKPTEPPTATSNSPEQLSIPDHPETTPKSTPISPDSPT